MRRSIDVPALVTGIILLGFSGVAGWLLLGRPLVGPPTMWFAAVLMVAGVTGLIASLGSQRP